MKIKVYLFICLLAYLSCKTKAYETEKVGNVKSSEKLLQLEKDTIKSFFETKNYLLLPLIKPPITSSYIDTMYTYSEGDFKLKDYLKSKKSDTKYFSLEKKREKVEDYKDQYFYHFFYDGERDFYPVFNISKGNYSIIGVFTLFYGENDIPGVQFELHSFDKKGMQIDYLLVYCRFTFEISYENNFKLDRDFNFFIEKQMTDYFYENLEKERDVPLITKSLEKYKINEKGFFIKN